MFYDLPVIAQINGILIGQIRNNTKVHIILKLEILIQEEILIIVQLLSEKARTIGKSVLKAILRKYNQ